jgi:hypothetical protein
MRGSEKGEGKGLRRKGNEEEVEEGRRGKRKKRLTLKIRRSVEAEQNN